MAMWLNIFKMVQVHRNHLQAVILQAQALFWVIGSRSKRCRMLIRCASEHLAYSIDFVKTKHSTKDAARDTLFKYSP